MTRTLFDSVDASAIPATAAMIAGYVDGAYAWSSPDWARFPNAVKVRIAVNPATNDGHVLDVEPGNWSAADSVNWTIMRRAAGVEPTIYAGAWAPGYTIADVINAHYVRGVTPPQIWLANQDGVGELPAGYIAKQYLGAAQLGFNADQSVVADFWPGVDTAPPTPPAGPDIPSAVGRLNSIIVDAQNALEDLAYPSGGIAVIQLPPPPSRSFIAPTWLPLVLSAILIIAQQALVTLKAVPASTPVTVTILILTILSASIPAIETLLGQQQAHTERVAMLHSGRVIAP